jgi:hypothetical protein
MGMAREEQGRPGCGPRQEVSEVRLVNDPDFRSAWGQVRAGSGQVRASGQHIIQPNECQRRASKLQ